MTLTESSQKLSPKQIYESVQYAREHYASGNPLFKDKDFHRRVYDDNIWQADLTVSAASGAVTWQITKKDKNGTCQISPFTMYRAKNGQIEYNADYKIKQDITKRLCKTYEYLEQAV